MCSYQRMLFVQVGRLTILISDITKTQDPVPCLTRLVIAISDFKENLLVES